MKRNYFVALLAASALLLAAPGAFAGQANFLGTDDTVAATGNTSGEFVATAEAGGYRISATGGFNGGTADIIGLASNLGPDSITSEIGTGAFTITMELDPSNTNPPDYDHNANPTGGSSGFNGTMFGLFIGFDSTGDGAADQGLRIAWSGQHADAGGGGISAMVFVTGTGNNLGDARNLGGPFGSGMVDVSGTAHTMGLSRDSSGAFTLSTSAGEWNSDVFGADEANSAVLTTVDASTPIVLIGFFANEEEGALPADSGLFTVRIESDNISTGINEVIDYTALIAEGQAPFEAQAPVADLNKTDAQAIYNSVDDEIAIVYVHEAPASGAGDFREEVRMTILDASDLTVVKANDVLIMQQEDPPAGDDADFDNLAITYSASAGEYIVAVGAELDYGPDIGQIWLARVTPGTAAPVGGTVTVATLDTGADGPGNILDPAPLDVAVSTDNGNILVAYEVEANNGFSSGYVVASLFDSTLTQLNTVTTVGDKLGNNDDDAVAGGSTFAVGIHIKTIFDSNIGAFLVTYMEYSTANGGNVTNQQLRVRVVDDVVSAGALVLGIGDNIISTSDYAGQTDTTDSTLQATGDNQQDDFDRAVLNPFSTGANDTYVLAMRRSLVGEPNANGNGFMSASSGISLQFFGLGAAPDYAAVPGDQVVVVAASASGNRTFPKLHPMVTAEKFAIVWIDGSVNDQVRLVLADTAGNRVQGGTSGILLSVDGENVSDGGGDGIDLVYVPVGNGNYLLAVWQQGDDTGTVDDDGDPIFGPWHPVAARVNFVEAPEVPLAVRDWKVFE